MMWLLAIMLIAFGIALYRFPYPLAELWSSLREMGVWLVSPPKDSVLLIHSIRPNKGPTVEQINFHESGQHAAAGCPVCRWLRNHPPGSSRSTWP